MNAAPMPKTTGQEPCRRNPDWWHPERRSSETATAIWACKHLCPIFEGCLAYGLTHAVSGIWGGTTARERKRARHRLGIRAVPVIEQSDHEMIIRAYRRGMPLQVIADLAEVSVITADNIIKDWRGEQREEQAS